jgi:DHA2 family multidrug resistance protein
MAFILGFGLYGSINNSIYTIHFRMDATDAGLLLIPGSITTAFMMPLLVVNSKGVTSRLHDWCWVLVFFFVMMHNRTPDTGEDDMYWALILRGIGLGLLFVPITTLSLSTLSGKNIGEGAAFTV